MNHGEAWNTALWLREISRALAGPTHLLLLAAAAWAVFEVGSHLYERLPLAPTLSRTRLLAQARSSIHRADILSRIGPMLGLMGTLIPLGPGLAALGRGEVQVLASAVTVAFDTTVLGLAVGIVGFSLGRSRRGLYDKRLDTFAPEATDV